MTKFKRGDKVRVKPGARSAYDYGPTDYDEVRIVRNPEIILSGAARFRTVVVLNEDNSGSAFYRESDLVPVLAEDSPVSEAAVKKWADNNGLCDEFDLLAFQHYGWSSRKHKTPTLGEVRRLVHREGYGELFDAEFPPPEPGYPETGKWVRLTTKDGKTHDVLVTNKPSDSRHVIWIAPDPRQDKSHFYLLLPGYRGAMGASARHVTSWEYLDHPWKVGDVVPAGTIVGKQWTGLDSNGRGHTMRADVQSALDRTIVWIED